jgi:CRISPR-associated protein Csb1
MATQLTFEALRAFVTGGAVAIRGKAILEPAGGPGDKVFPPTHSVSERASSRYAFESRRINGREARCVLLDSVQSQANRMEEALQALWADARIVLPVVSVDFSEIAPDVGIVTSLTAPHRIADALLRDSLNGTTLFRMSAEGRSFTDATPRNAAPLFKVCPTGLVFGLWDSTGPKGGLGSKFARALVSEIVGIDAVEGVKTASRIDPAGIVKKSAEVYVASDANEGWTVDPTAARQDDGEPIKYGKDGKPSEVNHGNVAPSIDSQAGGVTIEHAEHVVVLSLAALRRLGFGGGSTDDAARTVLSALGLLVVVAAESRGYDLRSRCLLVPRAGQGLALQVVRRDGTTEDLKLDLEQAISIYNAAVAALPESLRFAMAPGQPLVKLTPSKKLAHLIAKSREVAAAGAEVEGE